MNLTDLHVDLSMYLKTKCISVLTFDKYYYVVDLRFDR